MIPPPTPSHPSTIGRLSADDGQATAEYALVMVAAATLAGLLIAWATSTNGVARVMNAVVESLVTAIP